MGIDIGTSGIKVIAMHANGQVVASANVSYRIDVPEVGWAEQHPDYWWRAMIDSMMELTSKLQQGDHVFSIQSMSLSGQMHGLVLLDKFGQILRPAIIWCDVRTNSQTKWIEQLIGNDCISRNTNNFVLPNFTATKLQWVKENEPEIYAQITHVLLPKDYIRYKMTGRYGTDVTDASGTLWFDVQQRKWSDTMIQALSIPYEWLPEVFESTAHCGFLTEGVARQFGVPSGIPVIAGAGDQAAGALGSGVIREGQVSIVLGTSGVVLTPTKSPTFDPTGSLHCFCHAIPDTWFLMGVTQAAGGSLEWYREVFLDNNQVIDHDRVFIERLAEAACISPGSEGLLFLPYLMGERTPILDPLARGAWIGLSRKHKQAHMIRSLIEGVSLSLLDCLKAVENQGISLTEWYVTGGGSKSQLWVQILSACIKQPLEIIQSKYGPAMGAAMIAAEGVGFGESNLGNINTDFGVKIEGSIEWMIIYEKLYPIYRKAYAQLKELFVELSQSG